MKKLFLAVLALGLSTGALYAQKAKATKSKAKAEVKIETPESVKSAFSSKFSDVADAKWKKNYSGNYVAIFDKDGITTDAEYTPDGTWVASHTRFTAENMPEAVATTIKNKYPSASIKDGVKVEQTSTGAYYKVKIDDNGASKEVLVDDNGTLAE